jgi:Right handed beta helix region
MLNLPISPRQPRRTTRRRHPLVEDLEGRQLLSTFNVTNANDTGTGSLRAAIQASNATTGTPVNAIDFQIGTGGIQTITLRSELPTISHPVVIDGTTEPGTGSAPRVVLNGSSAGTSVVGLTISASRTTIKGLAIDNFTGDGVDINAASGDLITDDFIGISPTGATAANGANGITISGNSSGNTVGGTTSGLRNVISGNVGEGIMIVGATATGNLVEGNYIGTNVAGNAPIGNGDSGVLIETNSDNNAVGGTASGAGNVISGNGARGVHITGTASGNLVEGNYIGTNVAGNSKIGNGQSGVLIDTSSDNNTIGGTIAGAGNVISGNIFYGVHITISASDNRVEGNLIGTNAAGSTTLGNAVDGVLIDVGAAGNTIGGTVKGAANTISYNVECGVTVSGAGQANLIEGDVINNNGFGQPTAGDGDGVSIGTSPYTTVINCTIESNRDWGILSDDSAHLVVTPNTFQSNGLGSVLIT